MTNHAERKALGSQELHKGPKQKARTIDYKPLLHPLLTRERRILEGLLTGPKTREQVDRLGKVSNGPEYIRQLRLRGLEIDCERRCFVNEDGNRCCPGVYRLNESSVADAMAMLYPATAR